jgi:hypothetical protein
MKTVEKRREEMLYSIEQAFGSIVEFLNILLIEPKGKEHRSGGIFPESYHQMVQFRH